MRKVLILAFDIGGQVDKVHFGLFVHGGVNGAQQIGVCPRLPRADIENTADFGMFQKPQNHIDAILNPHKVAHLVAVFVSGIFRFEQRKQLAAFDAGMNQRYDTLVAGLVIFVRPVQIEKPKTDPLRRNGQISGCQINDFAVNEQLCPCQRRQGAQFA